MERDLLILFPGALGDFLCFRPALRALRREARGAVALVARAELFPLLTDDGLALVSIDRREVADLFADGEIADSTRQLFGGFSRVLSWTGHGNSNFAARLGQLSTGATRVHAFHAIRRGEHAADYYARTAEVRAPFEIGAPSAGAESWAEEFWLRHRLPARTLIVHAGSGSPKKNWEGMNEAILWWRATIGAPVIHLRGPAERERGGAADDGPVVDGEPLDRVAALLRRAGLYLGNDSGVSHLAAQVGAAGLALFGPSDPDAWRPLGDSLAVLHAPAACPECGADRFCVHRLPVKRVCAALARLARTRSVPHA